MKEEDIPEDVSIEELEKIFIEQGMRSDDVDLDKCSKMAQKLLNELGMKEINEAEKLLIASGVLIGTVEAVNLNIRNNYDIPFELTASNVLDVRNEIIESELTIISKNAGDFV